MLDTVEADGSRGASWPKHLGLSLGHQLLLKMPSFWFRGDVENRWSVICQEDSVDALNARSPNAQTANPRPAVEQQYKTAVYGDRTLNRLRCTLYS